MQLAGVWPINHSEAEGQPAQKRRQPEGNGQSDRKGEHSGQHRHLSVSISSSEAETRSRSLDDTYQSRVRWRPSLNITFGPQPRSCFAGEMSATRLSVTVAFSGCSAT